MFVHCIDEVAMFASKYEPCDGYANALNENAEQNRNRQNGNNQTKWAELLNAEH